MHNPTLLLSILVFIIVCSIAFFAMYWACWWQTLRRISLWSFLGKKFKHLSDDVEPDKLYARPLPLELIVASSVVFGLLLSFLFAGVCGWMASRAVQSNLGVVQDYLEQAGYGDNNEQVVMALQLELYKNGSLTGNDLNRARAFAADFAGVDPTDLQSVEAMGAVVTMVKDEPGSGISSCDLFAEILWELQEKGGDGIGSDNKLKQELKDHVRQSIRQDNSFEYFMSSISSLPPTNGVSLSDVARGLQSAYEEPGVREVIAGLYKRLSAEVRSRLRTRALLVGWIQGSTYAVFFFGLLLVANRLAVRMGVVEDVSAQVLKHVKLGTTLDDLVDRILLRLDRIEYSPIDYAVYAMPSIGFIGTVLGIGLSLQNADLVVRASDAEQQSAAVTIVTGQLGLAFDTTLVALVLSVLLVLMASIMKTSESKGLLTLSP